MKRIFVIFAILAIFISFSGQGIAKIPIPGRTESRVNDYAGILDKETKDYLENLISSIGQKTPEPIEVIVAVFHSLEGWQFNEFAVLYGEKWREIKKGKRDNGVILLVALQERQVVIGPGHNLKNILTADIIRGIIQDVILPEFNEERYDKGIKKATETIVAILSGADIPAGSPLLNPKTIIITTLLILLLFLGRRLFLRRK